MSAHATVVAVTQPDAAVVDIRMPSDGDSRLRAAREIRVRHRHVGILVLSHYARPSYAFELLGESTERVGYLHQRPPSTTWPSWPMPSAASDRADPCSTRSSYLSSSAGPDALHDLSDRERELFNPAVPTRELRHRIPCRFVQALWPVDADG